MSTQAEYDKVYLGNAIGFSRLSKSRRTKVGACLVTPTGVVLPGYNGTPSGADNNCEDEIDGVLVTKPSVIHAELNTIMKAAKQGVSVNGAVMYVTLSPCESCSAMLVQAGIKRVVYSEKYRDDAGIKYLLEHGVQVEHWSAHD